MPPTVTRLGPRRDAGFTLIEVLVVCAVIGIVAGMVVPQTASMMGGYRLKGNAEAVNNLVGLAKIRAAAKLSRARVRANIAARTVQLETWDRANSQWVTEGGVLALAHGVSFGFGAITVAPPNTQAVLGQSQPCTDDANANIANTACITFNSRGMPVTNVRPPLGVLVGNSALYITDGSAVYGTTVTMAPFIKFWWSKNANNQWVRQ